MSNRIYFFDTTLRDGEQSPGVSLTVNEKLQIAQQLEKLGVDVIEAGFPIASPGDFEAVRTIAQHLRNTSVAGLARANQKDIDRAWEALKYGANPRIHTFIATSDIHLQHKLRKSREEVLEQAVAMVKYAKSLTSNIEFSAEDAFRSDVGYLCQVLEAVIDAGAIVVNIPDTVGYATPGEFGEFIRQIKTRVPNIHKARISVLCHNDLGLAVANSLAAVQNGAEQIECTMNGIGERAGNAALEEVVMALYTRKALFDKEYGIRTQEISKTSKMVSMLTGMSVQPNKAIVGRNAFAHESGIHQDGVLKERSTYEIMNPELIGLQVNNIVLGKHSGRHAFKDHLAKLGIELSTEELDKAFASFKQLADKKKDITDYDIIALVQDELQMVPETYALAHAHVESGTDVKPTAVVRLQTGGQVLEARAEGEGTVDATYNAIDKIVGRNWKLLSYILTAVTEGTDALGELTVTIEANDRKAIGRGLDTDIVIASAKAYINAINKLLYELKVEEKVTDEEKVKP